MARPTLPLARPQRSRLWVIPPVLLSAVVLYPVTRSYFFKDDFLNLYALVDQGTWRFMSTPFFGHVLPARNAVFALSYHLFGPDPTPYYWVALLTHLLNVWALFHVIRRLTGDDRLACLGAGVWGSSALHAGVLGWYSVYGQVLVATMLLVIWLDVAAAVGEGRVLSRWAPVRWYACALVAATSFGNGTAIALALPFALWLSLPAAYRPRWIFSLLIAVPAIYWGLILAYEHEIQAQVPSRPSWELIGYSWLLALRFVFRILSYSLTRLASGFALPPFPPDPPEPWSILVVVALAALVFVAARRAGRPTQRQLIALTLLLIACFGSIALARPFERDFRIPRYHYVGQLLLTLILCVAASRYLARSITARLVPAALALWYLGTGIGYGMVGLRFDGHREERARVEHVLGSIASAVAAAPVGDTVHIVNRRFSLLGKYTLFPGWAALFAIFHPDNVIDGRRVLFVESDARIIAAARHSRRSSSLFVPPGPAPEPPGRATPSDAQKTLTF